MKRSCGSCNLCCKIMEVVPEVKPDNHDWCQHANRPAGCAGCKIYERRPQECRDFHCMWVIDQRFGEYWYPARSKIVIVARSDPDVVAFIVDPDYPLRWRQEPFFQDIKEIARAGINGRLGKTWITVVLVGDERIPIIAGPSRSPQKAPAAP